MQFQGFVVGPDGQLVPHFNCHIGNLPDRGNIIAQGFMSQNTFNTELMSGCTAMTLSHRRTNMRNPNSNPSGLPNQNIVPIRGNGDTLSDGELACVLSDYCNFSDNPAAQERYLNFFFADNSTKRIIAALEGGIPTDATVMRYAAKSKNGELIAYAASKGIPYPTTL